LIFLTDIVRTILIFLTDIIRTVLTFLTEWGVLTVLIFLTYIIRTVLICLTDIIRTVLKFLTETVLTVLILSLRTTREAYSSRRAGSGRGPARESREGTAAPGVREGTN
jgi:hypothetical protein